MELCSAAQLYMVILGTRYLSLGVLRRVFRVLVIRIKCSQLHQNSVRGLICGQRRVETRDLRSQNQPAFWRTCTPLAFMTHNVKRIQGNNVRKQCLHLGFTRQREICAADVLSAFCVLGASQNCIRFQGFGPLKVLFSPNCPSTFTHFSLFSCQAMFETGIWVLTTYDKILNSLCQ